MLVYLAVHRRASSDQLMDAVWNGAIIPDKTFWNTVASARSAAGRDADGEHNLRFVDGNFYELSPAVGLDYERFRRHHGAARRAVPRSTKLELYRKALDVVRGRPFDGALDEYQWAHASVLVATMSAEIADAAHEMADLCLDRNDTAGVRWAVAKGLAAGPGNEQLIRDLMLAADLDGNPTGIEQIVAEYMRSSLDDVDDGTLDERDVLHPETYALLERLRRGRLITPPES
jgi:hypothetical protein